MKKIILAFALLFAVSVQAQYAAVHLYGGYTNNLMGSDQYITSFESPGFIGGVGINVEFDVSDWFSWYIGSDVEMYFSKDEIGAYILPNVGVYFGYENTPYVYLSFYPHINVVGIGHHQMGDYLCLWAELDMGVGYEYKIKGPHSIYAEAGVGYEMTLYQAEELRYNNPQVHNEVPLCITLGYRYYIKPE